jgi:hypothetical protein
MHKIAAGECRAPGNAASLWLFRRADRGCRPPVVHDASTWDGSNLAFKIADNAAEFTAA